jgi:hypothetical protein
MPGISLFSIVVTSIALTLAFAWSAIANVRGGQKRQAAGYVLLAGFALAIGSAAAYQIRDASPQEWFSMAAPCSATNYCQK